jgi:signal transduction histidine kinase
VIGSDGVPRQFVALRAPRPREQLRQLLAVQIVSSLLVLGVLGWFLARGIARPVRALSDATRRMSAGELDARVAQRWTRGSDEIGALARDFNAMATRIEALIANQRGVLQDISHELRSPLARLQLHLELARRESTAARPQLDRAESEIARLDRLLTEILALTRLEAGLPGMRREPCELTALARERIAERQSAAAAMPRQIALEASSPVWVSGSAPLLERALDNLLDNAIKYGCTAPDTPARVLVRIQQVGERAELRVRDHGPGVAEADLPSLFRAFYRGHNSAGQDGQGLGLAVVARIAGAHGGTVQAHPAAGGGLEVVVQLPAIAAPA